MTKLVSSTILSGERKQQESKQAALEPVSQCSTHLLPATSSYREEVHKRSAAARARLDAATLEAGWAAGQAMTEEQAITEALQDA